MPRGLVPLIPKAKGLVMFGSAIAHTQMLERGKEGVSAAVL